MAFDQRGRKPSFTSYLTDPDIREQAREWLRMQLRNMRKKVKDPTDTPLTLPKFHRYCNEVLLKPVLDQHATKKPISEQTAYNWLRKLGFDYEDNNKCVFFDGHERPDVVQARRELLVMLKVLEEVTVTYGGKDCEVVIWPKLHPGERPVV